jgi:hypothetical protein
VGSGGFLREAHQYGLLTCQQDEYLLERKQALKNKKEDSRKASFSCIKKSIHTLKKKCSIYLPQFLGDFPQIIGERTKKRTSEKRRSALERICLLSKALHRFPPCSPSGE